MISRRQWESLPCSKTIKSRVQFLLRLVTILSGLKGAYPAIDTLPLGSLWAEICPILGYFFWIIQMKARTAQVQCRDLIVLWILKAPEKDGCSFAVSSGTWCARITRDQKVCGARDVCPCDPLFSGDSLGRQLKRTCPALISPLECPACASSVCRTVPRLWKTPKPVPHPTSNWQSHLFIGSQAPRVVYTVDVSTPA